MFRRVYGEMRPDRYAEFEERYRLAREKIAEECWKREKVMLDVENIQSNFVFHFPETGHNVHKRRPVEIARILEVYLVVVGEMEKAAGLKRSKL